MTLGRLLALTLVFAVLGYLGVHMINFISPPPLALAFPPPGFITANHAIEIIGQTAPGARLEINGRPFPAPANGLFKHLLVLNDGVTVITIKARKRYGRVATIERQILVRNENQISRLQAPAKGI